MVHSRWKKIAGSACVALALAACGGPGAEEFDAIAKKEKLNKSERVALEACHKTMKGNKPILVFGDAQKMMSEVPLEVCACQSRTMALVFQEGEYKSYSKVTKYLGRLEKKGLPRLSRKDMKKGLQTDPSVKKLVASFQTCAFKFVADNKTNPEYADFLLPPPEPKKKKKKGHSEQQASK